MEVILECPLEEGWYLYQGPSLMTIDSVTVTIVYIFFHTIKQQWIVEHRGISYAPEECIGRWVRLFVPHTLQHFGG